MSQTVIALFHLAAEAREAESQLLRAGFTNDMVDVSNGPSLTPVPGNDRQEGTIRRFFRELFGQEPEPERYTAAAATDTVVTVHAETPDDAARASQILDDAGAIDIDALPPRGLEPIVVEPPIEPTIPGPVRSTEIDLDDLPTPGGRVGVRSRES